MEGNSINLFLLYILWAKIFVRLQSFRGHEVALRPSDDGGENAFPFPCLPHRHSGALRSSRRTLAPPYITFRRAENRFFASARSAP